MADNFTPLMVQINKRLRKWRRRDLACEDWAAAGSYGVNAIRNGLAEKAEAYEALYALQKTGHVVRAHFTNDPSILWQSAPIDMIDISLGHKGSVQMSEAFALSQHIAKRAAAAKLRED